MPSNRPITRHALALCGLAILVIESLLYLLPEGQMTNTVRFRMREILTLPAPDIEIMGDSAAARLPASVVEQQLNARTVSNYALNGTSPYFAPFVLQRQIDAGRAPKAIIYAPHPATLASPMLERFFGRFAIFDEARRAARDGIAVSDLIFGALCKASYTLRYHEELRTVVTEGHFDFFRTARWPVPSVQLSRAPQPLPPPDPPHVFRHWELSPQLTRPLSVDPLNVLALDRFCELAASRNIRIYWVSLPLPQSLDPHDTEAIRRYAAFLRELAARHANVILLHPTIDILPDQDFSDPWHLTAHAAWLFSEEIGRELRDHIPPLPH